jgi:serine/threonine-protein kinase RIO1
LGLNTVLDLFSEKGELLYTLENDSIIPEIGMLIHSDQEGYIYTAINRPYTIVKKFKIHISKPK